MKFGADGTMQRRAFFLLGSVVLALALSGCAHDSKPVQYYRLSVDSGNGARLPAVAQGPVIGLGPIRIPEYLDRPQMIVAITDNQYRLSEEHRWTDRLDQNISLALFKALPGQLGTDKIVRYPWPQRQLVDYQIGIDILEFNVDANGQSRLIAQWTIKRKDQPAIDKRSDYRFPASSTDYDVMVKAQSQCLSKLSQEIAETIRQLMLSTDNKQSIRIR